MKKPVSLFLFLFSASLCTPAQEGQRDADAVLNRCGKPLKGDDTLYTNEGSTRTLEYERGNLVFVRVGNEGWKFDHGTHKKELNLNAKAMATFFPCLPLALADSASPAPLKNVSAVQRLEVSAAHSPLQIILAIMAAFVVLFTIMNILRRRKRNDQVDE